MAVGAASGALAGALTDVGVDDKFMKGLAAEDLKNGEAVLFVLVKKVTGDKVLGAAQGRRRPDAADLARPHPRGEAARGAGRRTREVAAKASRRRG